MPQSASGPLESISGHVLFEFGGTPITVERAIAAVAVLLLAWGFSIVIRRGLVRGMRRRGVSSEGTLAATSRLTHYAVIVAGFGVAMRALGLDITSLFAAGAVFALGLSFAMQNIAQNFVSGVILLLERSIKPGDILEVEGRVVRVYEMGIRATYARTLDDEVIIVPNSTIVQSSVKSYTLQGSRYRVRTKIGVAFDSDMALVRRTLENVAKSYSPRIADMEPLVLFFEFGESSVMWEVSVWIDDPWRMRRLRSGLQEAIWTAFRQQRIAIAYPQLDVHVDAQLLEALAKRAA
jgi:potassium-dependent mechanosensitive channel